MTDQTPSYFRRLFAPLAIGNFTVPNRIVSTTHGSQLPRDRDLRYIQERARGGVGLFGLGAGAGLREYGPGVGARVTAGRWDAPPPSPLTPAGIALYDDMEIPALRERARIIHACGARVYGQVAHAGASNFWVSTNPLIGPSNVATPIDAITPYELSGEEVEELIFCFAHSIRRVADSGLDAAEIHGAHGYLINQFLSPYYNRREDRWGGSTEKRVRLPIAIIAAARKLVGDDFPIGIRLSYEGDAGGPGTTLEELVEIARLLEPHVCHISISGGNATGFFRGLGRAYVSSWYTAPGYNAAAGAAVRQAVRCPVIVGGRIADPALAEGLLADGSADLVGMVRGLIADPQLIEKAKRGDAGRQRMCLGLSECHHEGRYRVHVTCAVNAAAGREDELAIVPSAERKTVVVVGAGPAGLEASRVCARRGHKVYLCDRSRQVGGTVRILARDPNRRNLLDHSSYFEAELAELDVELVLGHEVSADDISGFEADAVIIATGGKPRIPEVPVIDRANVVTWDEVLLGSKPIGKRVLVVGGIDNHIAAPSIAEYLVDMGHDVQLVSEQPEFAAAVEDVTRYELQRRLHKKGVVPQLATKLVAVDDGAVLSDIFSGREWQVNDTTVVFACGLVPENRLYRQLKGRVRDLYIIGDALAPRRIMHATLEGARTGVLI